MWKDSEGTESSEREGSGAGSGGNVEDDGVDEDAAIISGDGSGISDACMMR